MTEQIVNVAYKYTFPIEKAFIGEDGKRRLVGAATGPEVDLENQRVHPVLIDKWIGQINNGLIEVVYDNQHKKDDVLTDLGMVEKAWKDEKGHMYVQVILDDDNPVSTYIHKAALKGKQYGMSIWGKATRYADELVSNQRVRTIMDGTLERIAHTTRPIWTPSFGTVLSKAIDDAERVEPVAGETTVAENTTETKVVETTEEVKTESGAATNPATGAAPENGDGTAAAVVEKAISADTVKDAKNLDKIVTQYQALGKVLKDAGLIDEQAKATGGEAETDTKVEKSEDKTENGDVAVLSKSVEDLTKLVTALADRISDGTAPGVLSKSTTIDPIDELRAVEDPLERMRLAFAAQSGNGSALR